MFWIFHAIFGFTNIYSFNYWVCGFYILGSVCKKWGFAIVWITPGINTVVFLQWLSVNFAWYLSQGMFCVRWWSPIVAGAMWHNVAHYGTMWQDHNVLSKTLWRNTIHCTRGTSPWKSFFTFAQILPFVAGEGLCCQMQYGKAWREAKWGLHFRNSLYHWNLVKSGYDVTTNEKYFTLYNTSESCVTTSCLST